MEYALNDLFMFATGFLLWLLIIMIHALYRDRFLAHAAIGCNCVVIAGFALPCDCEKKVEITAKEMDDTTAIFTKRDDYYEF